MIKLSGPLSAPNGDKKLVVDAKHREALRSSGKLQTGKTQKKNK